MKTSPEKPQSASGDVLFGSPAMIPDSLRIAVGLLMAGPAALKQAAVALRAEQALLIEARLPEAVIDVRGDDEIMFFFLRVSPVHPHSKNRDSCPSVQDSCGTSFITSPSL